MVIVLFGVMNLGAFVGFREDMQSRAELLRKLQARETGFAEMTGGVWTWTLTQLRPTKSVDAPRGTGPALARKIGIPFVRLRAAVPEELFPGAPGWAVGRASGLSSSALSAAMDEHKDAFSSLRRPSTSGMDKAAAHRHFAGVADGDEPSSPDGMSRKSAMLWSLDVEEGGGTEQAGEASARHEQLAGTALMFAFMTIFKVVPVLEFGRRLSAARTYFSGVRAPGVDHDFDYLMTLFMGMLAEQQGTICARKHWMNRARVWRLAFLQRSDGALALRGCRHAPSRADLHVLFILHLSWQAAGIWARDWPSRSRASVARCSPAPRARPRLAARRWPAAAWTVTMTTPMQTTRWVTRGQMTRRKLTRRLCALRRSSPPPTARSPSAAKPSKSVCRSGWHAWRPLHASRVACPPSCPGVPRRALRRPRRVPPSSRVPMRRRRGARTSRRKQRL